MVANRPDADGRPVRPGPGRPSRYTPENVAKIDQALRSGATRSAAAAFGGIALDTLNAWERNFAEFAATVRAAETAAELMYTAVLAKAAQGEKTESGEWVIKPDIRAAMYWLERRRHADWGRKDRIEIVDGVRKLAEAAGWTADEVAEAVRQAQELVRAK